MATYYGRYKSSKNGCLKEFASLPSNALAFVPQVNYLCDLCKAIHGFRLTATSIVDSPIQERRFTEFCKSHYIERDVEVPVKNS